MDVATMVTVAYWYTPTTLLTYLTYSKLIYIDEGS